MENLKNIQARLLKEENQKVKQAGYSSKFVLDEQDLDVGVLMDLWLAENPQPTILVSESEYALQTAIWILKKEQACCFFNKTSFDIDVASCKRRIEQEIANRDPSKTMLESAIAYVENVLNNPIHH